MIYNPNETFYIKEVHIKLFYEYISEMSKIPDTKGKLTFLRSMLQRFTRVSPFKILFKYFVERVLYGEIPKIKVLPLTTEGDTDRITSFEVNLPQIDLLISKGLNDTRFRQATEDFIYSTKDIIQKFLCDYANCENIFKIPKEDLKKFADEPRLRIDNCKILDLKHLSDDFVGWNKPYLKNYSLVPKRYLEKDNVNFLPSFRAVEVLTKKYFRDRQREFNRRNSLKYDHQVQQGIPSSYTYKFPALVYFQDEGESPLYYFIRRNDLTYTNMQGMMKQWFLLLAYKVKNLAYAGYYKNDTFYTVICTYLEAYVRHTIEGKAGKYYGNPTSYMNGFDEFLKRFEQKKVKMELLPKFKLARKFATPLMGMEHLLNFLLLNKLKYKQNLTIMFMNNICLSPLHIIKKVLFLEYDYKTNKAKVQTLDEDKKIYYVHRTRLSVKNLASGLNKYVGRECYLFKFEIGGDFLLMDILKDFTWDTECYEKGSVKKLTLY